MRIFFKELRHQCLTWGTLLILAVMALTFWRISSYSSGIYPERNQEIQEFKGGNHELCNRTGSGNFKRQLLADIVFENGRTTLMEEDFDTLNGYFQEEIEVFEDFIKNSSACKALKISNVEDYCKYREEAYNSDEESSTLDRILSDQLFEEMQESPYHAEIDIATDWLRLFSFLKESFESRKENLSFFENPTLEQQKRLDEIKEGNMLSPLPGSYLKGYECLTNLYLSVVVILLLFFQLRIFQKDKNRKLIPLQYTTKVGRSLMKTKIISSVFLTFCLLTVALCPVVIFLHQHGYFQYFNMDFNSYDTLFLDFFWFDITLGEYMLCTLLLYYLFALGGTLIIACLSHWVNHYITGIAVTIPLTIGAILTCNEIFAHIFYLNSSKYLGILLVAFIFLFAIGFCLFTYFYEKRKATVNG